MTLTLNLVDDKYNTAVWQQLTGNNTVLNDTIKWMRPMVTNYPCLELFTVDVYNII